MSHPKGASGGSYKDWIATDKEMLDLLREDDWAYYFESKPLDAILAEHVWEHLDHRAALVAAQNCFTYLKPGGYIRIAMPDGLHPDKGYIDRVKPGGWGQVQMIIASCIHTKLWKQSLHM